MWKKLHKADDALRLLNLLSEDTHTSSEISLEGI